MFLQSIEKEIDRFVEDLKSELRGKDVRIQYLEHQNQNLINEKYKDKELLRMKTSLDKMKEDYYRGFPISKKEQVKIDEWIEKHEKEVHNCHTIDNKLRRSGCMGGTYTYEFIPTSIGTIGTIKCNCGAEFIFKEMD